MWALKDAIRKVAPERFAFIDDTWAGGAWVDMIARQHRRTPHLLVQPEKVRGVTRGELAMVATFLSS